jgi:hypothetical protein
MAVGPRITIRVFFKEESFLDNNGSTVILMGKGYF